MQIVMFIIMKIKLFVKKKQRIYFATIISSHDVVYALLSKSLRIFHFLSSPSASENTVPLPNLRLTASMDENSLLCACDGAKKSP